ncbi:MAG TPA: DMT family transporter [Candidatus Dormibacteraeota bacterium]|nr:DMT family transporter [Candidatus Dormibacteraeota bacterium]
MTRTPSPRRGQVEPAPAPRRGLDGRPGARARLGTPMVLASAACFGTLPVLAKLAYASGLSATQTLAFRFVLGAAGLLALAGVLRQDPRRLGLRRALQLVALGMFGYAATSGTFFLALLRLPASLTELIAYIYPSLVAIGALVFFRRRIGPRQAAALVVSFMGLSLLVGGLGAEAGTGGPALLLAVASPVLYACYMLAGERLMRATPVILGSGLVHTGAAVTFVASLAITGSFRLPTRPASWALLVVLAIVPSMLGISLFLAGLPRVGAAQAALLSTFEPIVTVALAVSLLGDRLAPLQVVGAAAVIAAVVVVQLRRPATVPPMQP